MKHKNYVFSAAIGLSAILIFLSILALAQVPVATPILPPLPPEEKPFVRSSREADEKGNPREYRYMMAVGVKTFVDEANRLGRSGYRMEMVAGADSSLRVIDAPPPGRFKHIALAGIFKLDKQNTYEYDWFEADIPGEIVTRINFRAEKGFYYRDGVFATDYSGCREEPYNPNEDSVSVSLNAIASFLCWSQGGIYFMERKNAEVSEREYRVHIGKFGWGKSPTEELQNALDNSGQLGFRPVALGKMKHGMSYAFYTLVVKNKAAKAEPLKTQYKFLKSEFSFSKKVNVFAKEGYRIKFGGMFGAYENVLLEKVDGAVTVSYKWVDASGKSHEQELAAAVNLGVRYLMMNREAEDLIFEDRPGEKYEYKILRMTPVVIKPTKKNPIPPPAKTYDEIFNEFDATLAEGYVIRDVFYSDGTRVLFERKK